MIFLLPLSLIHIHVIFLGSLVIIFPIPSKLVHIQGTTRFIFHFISLSLFLGMANIGNPNITSIYLLNNYDISDASSRTRLINPKILKVPHLEVRHPLVDFIEINDSFRIWRVLARMP